MAISDKPTVAVTGGSGFTGGALIKRLLDEGYSVRAIYRNPSKVEAADGLTIIAGDINDEAALAEMVKGCDTVFHIAAMYRSDGLPSEYMQVNYEGTLAVLEAAKKAGVRRFVVTSTIGVHGSVQRTPSDETAPFMPMDVYQESKLKAELAVRAEGEKGEIEIVVIRPCGIYGPGDMRMFKIFSMLQKGLFMFVGNGRPNFHPVYIDNLVQGLLLGMTVPEAKGEVFIIGDANYVPLREYVGTAAKTIGAKPPWLKLPYGFMKLVALMFEITFRPLGLSPPLYRRRLGFYSSNRAFSIEKARRILGYQPTIALEEGFRNTVAWYYDQGLLKRKTS
ncbi:MAG: NAD-dependent epimerase/dehydratase family protein [Sphingomonadaceae bacterium]